MEKFSLFIERWIAGLIYIAVGFMVVITFTLYRPFWDVDWEVWVYNRRNKGRKCDK